MCYKCSEDLNTPPWLWDPALTWCKNRHLKKEGGSICFCQRPNKTDKDFIDDVIKTHNTYRCKHGSPPLRHASDLTTQAQRWADHLASTNTFQHSHASLNGEKLGENIAMKWSTRPELYSGQEVTDQWYSEVKLHQFGSEPRTLSSGHFTQVVWKGSKEIGVGKSRSRDGKIIVVSNYRPAGNVIGHFTENVLPLAGQTSVVESKVSTPLGTRESRSRTETQVRKEQSSGFCNSPCTSKVNRSKMSESRSVRTFTETTGSGANKVTKTVTEETIIKADGSKVTNRKETVTHGDSGGSKSDHGAMSLLNDRKKEDKDKSAFSDFHKMSLHNADNDDFFKKDKDKRRDRSSSSDSSPERSKKPQKIKDFIEECVKVHNTYRKKHKAPPLKHAKDLSDFAQKWAEHLAATNTFQHSDCKLKEDRLGENIACKWSSGGGDYTGQEVCDQWYDEIKKHDFSSEPRTTGTGHFTQMVWKGSKELGIGKAKTSGGKVIVVASYRPAGNLIGSYRENVNAPK